MSTILSNLAGTLRTAFRIARATLDVSGLTTARVATLPDKSGTIAMLDDLAGFAPATHVGAGGTAHATATTSVAGFMSSADKTKLDGVAAGATANTGTVTSVTVSVGTGMSGGGTVTTSGTISIALNANLQSWSGVAPSSYSVVGHTHAAGDITSGVFARLRLGPNAVAGRILSCTLTDTEWVDPSYSLSSSAITGVLPATKGGTGVTSVTGTGSAVLNNNPTFSNAIFVGSSGGGNAQIEGSASEANFLARNGVTLRLGQQFGQTADVHLYNGSGDRLTVKSSGRIGIGTTGPSEQLHVIGNILASGTITPNSDARVKTDIAPCRLTLDQIALTTPVEFTRITDGSRGLGVLAQDLEAVLPTAVLTADDEQGTKAVSYGEAAVVMVINLAREVQALRARIEELEHE